MSQSFTADGALAQTDNSQKIRVFVTGGGGNIGSYFARNSAQNFQITLLDRSLDKLREKGLDEFANIVEGDICDIEFLKNAFQNHDVVLHLAGDPSPNATWSSVRDTNISGTYNTFVAAKAAGCSRVIFASSIHAISGYPADVQVKTSDPANPGDLYGVSKVFGEAMARYMAIQEGISAICIRIGAFQPVEKAMDESALSLLDGFVSERDLNHLIECAIRVQNVKFAVVHGLSESRFKRMDITDTRELLGYAPQDSFTKLNPALKALNLDENVQSHSMADEGQKSGIREEVS